jgi:hypothetical protein
VHCAVQQFSIACPTAFGQRVWLVRLVGNAAGLGSWDVSCGLQLKWAEGGKWVGSVDLDAAATPAIKYKAVLQCGPGEYKWAAGDDFELALKPATAWSTSLLEAVCGGIMYEQLLSRHSRAKRVMKLLCRLRGVVQQQVV